MQHNVKYFHIIHSVDYELSYKSYQHQKIHYYIVYLIFNLLLYILA